VILDAETAPFIDVTAARMLVATHEELRAHGVRLVLARAVGQFRDVLRCIADDADFSGSYATIAAAVDDARAARPPATPAHPSPTH